MIIEDVVTSGGQIIDSCQRLRSLGAAVKVAAGVIDRDAGAAANLAREFPTGDRSSPAATSSVPPAAEPPGM